MAVAGPPNVGKSRLVNALAGYQRSVVSPGRRHNPGCRLVTPLALGGWPVELLDTAGLRHAADDLEAEGVERAKRIFAAGVDAVVWVLDGTAARPEWPADGLRPAVVVINKSDLAPGWDHAAEPDGVRVSAATGTGVADLVAAILGSLPLGEPPSGAAVPFTPALADRIERAAAALAANNPGLAREWLAEYTA